MSAASSVICALTEASSASLVGRRDRRGRSRSLRASSSMLVRSEVSGVRSSWPASAISCCWQVAGGGERGGHGVEGAGQPGDLVLALDRDADGQVLGAGDVLDGVGEPVDGLQARRGPPTGRRRRAEHADPGDERRGPARAGSSGLGRPRSSGRGDGDGQPTAARVGDRAAVRVVSTRTPRRRRPSLSCTRARAAAPLGDRHVRRRCTLHGCASPSEAAAVPSAGTTWTVYGRGPRSVARLGVGAVRWQRVWTSAPVTRVDARRCCSDVVELRRSAAPA